MFRESVHILRLSTSVYFTDHRPQLRYHCRTDVKCIVFCIWRHMVKVGRHVSDLTSIVSKSRNQQTTKWWDLGQSQSWANEAKRRRAVDWIEYTPVPSYLDLRIYLFSCILTPWKRLKLLLNLFYSCKIALKIFFPRGTEAVGRRQEYHHGEPSWQIWALLGKYFRS